MKRVSYSIKLHIPESLYEVIKNNVEHRLPNKNFVFNEFAEALVTACNHDKEKIAQVLREIFLKGLGFEVSELKFGIKENELSHHQDVKKKETKESNHTKEINPEDIKKLEEKFNL
jgi:hypothetical protein